MTAPGLPCESCELLPEALPERGQLLLAPPLEHTASRLRTYLAKEGWEFTAPGSSLLSVTIGPGDLARLGLSLSGLLSSVEMDDVRALVIAEGREPTIEDVVRARSLSRLVGAVQGAWLTDLLREGRLAAELHPIVHVNEPGRVYGHESLLRGFERDGRLVYPASMFPAARSAGLLFHLDRAARETAIHEARRSGISGALFINFCPTSIYDPAFCLRTTLRAMREAGLKNENVVFEVVETEEIRDVEHLLGILGFYRRAGFRVALDDLGAGYGSLDLLARLQPDFIKLDRQLVDGLPDDPYRCAIAANLLDLAGRLKTRSIAEGVEREEQMVWLRAHGADLVQGHLATLPPRLEPSKPLAGV